MRNTLYLTLVMVLNALMWIQPAAGQYLYFGPYPGSCSVDGVDGWRFINSWHIVVHCPENPNISGARFRLESDAYGIEDIVSINPASGVTITGSNPFEGLEFSWSPRDLYHESILTIDVTDNPPHQDPGFGLIAWTRDVVLIESGSLELIIQDCATTMTHCYSGGAYLWHSPDTAEVVVGKSSTVEFKGIFAGAGGDGGDDIYIEDDLGWISEYTPNWITLHCASCPWLWTVFRVTVEVPEGISQGTVSILRIHHDNTGEELTNFALEAMEPVPVEESTWGKIKALYQK